MENLPVEKPNRLPDFEDDSCRMWRVNIDPEKVKIPPGAFTIDIGTEEVYEQRRYRMLGARITMLAKRHLKTGKVTFKMKMEGPGGRTTHTAPITLDDLLEYGTMVAEFEETFGVLILESHRVDGKEMSRQIADLGRRE